MAITHFLWRIWSVSFQIPEQHFRVCCYLGWQELTEKPAHNLAVGKWYKKKKIGLFATNSPTHHRGKSKYTDRALPGTSLVRKCFSGHLMLVQSRCSGVLLEVLWQWQSDVQLWLSCDPPLCWALPSPKLPWCQLRQKQGIANILVLSLLSSAFLFEHLSLFPRIFLWFCVAVALI